MSPRKSILALLAVLLVVSSAAPDERPAGCPESCGGMAIQYPFGIGARCSRKGFEITCDRGTPVLAGATRPVPVNHLSIRTAEARVMLPIAWQCFNASDEVEAWSDGDVQFNQDGVYRISNTHNQVVVVGCNSLGFTRSQRSEGNDYPYAYYTGCMSFCNNSGSPVDGACAGVGCCHVDIPPGLTDNTMYFRAYSHVSRLDFSPCDYAFLVDRDNYTFGTGDLKMDVNRTMPVWLDWAIRDNLTCSEAKRNVQGYACVSSNSECYDASNGPGYVCNCTKGYEGNPYVVNGCTDINECERHEYPCRGVCRNLPGSYECKCPSGSHSADPFKEPCSSGFPLAAKIITSVVVGVLIIAVVVFISLLCKEKRKMNAIFKRNGGPTIKGANKIKLLRKKELDPILKIKTNCIGRGGFGEVYKGNLKVNGETNELVAIKRLLKERELDPRAHVTGQLANEIIVQSQVQHKNIVRLIGCCLEVKIPILVYEYVPNGSLDDALHGTNSVHLDLDTRLQIAAQSAKGLAYMHSEVTTPILHGDVKPANILLDNDFVPKISDFGASRMLTMDKMYTEHPIGQLGYIDPAHQDEGELTSKSDVYSFGVVLLELITRKKPSHADIASVRLSSDDTRTKVNRVVQLVDPEIKEEGDIKVFRSLAKIILQCLNPSVDQRPEMADVAERLKYLAKRSRAN